MTLRCVDRDGRDLAPVVRVEAVHGQPMTPMAIHVPSTAVPGEASLVVAVNGRPSLSVPVVAATN